MITLETTRGARRRLYYEEENVVDMSHINSIVILYHIKSPFDQKIARFIASSSIYRNDTPQPSQPIKELTYASRLGVNITCLRNLARFCLLGCPVRDSSTRFLLSLPFNIALDTIFLQQGRK